jgi:hypothetical protein
MALTPGQPTAVSTTVGNVSVTIALPNEFPGVGRIIVTTPTATVPITPISSRYQPLLVVEIDGFDQNGAPLTQLGSPMTISETFTASGNANPILAVFYTIDPTTGLTELLPTGVTYNSYAGTYTATAQVDHLSPFGLFSPNDTSPPTPSGVYLPIILNSVASNSSGW